MNRILSIIGVLAVAVALAPATASASAAVANSATHTETNVPNPLAAMPFYVEPITWAAEALKSFPSTAADVGVIARTAQAHWFGEWTPAPLVAAQVRTYVTAGSAAGAMPVLVLYAIPFRDCGGFSAGGLPGSRAYARWIRQVVRGIGSHPAAVILEPDALTSEDCLTGSARAARNAMLANAVDQLSARPTTAVYIDGGHSRWLTAAQLAARLVAVHVDRARGFSLNVSNFFTTSEEIAYGEQVSKLLGGKHYVVDTSRNGLGPAPDAPLNWCNPSGRSLGVPPTSTTAGAHADAYLWVKHPGESDGQCDRNEPVSGTWFNSYAVGLVRSARAIGIPLS